MSEHEKLQKAVELTIAAGYQLNKDAFEFLSLLATTEDPSLFIAKAIHQIENLQDKPFFIDKQFLQELVSPSCLSKEITDQELEAHGTEERERTSGQVITGKAVFNPYAKGIEANMKIVEDPGSQISSSGTIEDYVSYFQDRFRQLERLLRQRMDVKSATSVMDAVKAQASSRLKIIGMLTERRESKQKTFLTIEDLKASTVVLVPQNASLDLQTKTRNLLLDQVICISVLKSRSGLLVADDIILPDIAQKNQHKASDPVYAVLTSDMHVGSKLFLRDAFKRFILWLNGKYGDDRTRDIASHVKYVLIAGDIVDGIGVYPNQARELAIKDVNKQYRLAARYLEHIPDYIEVIITPGNHDAPRKALPQPPIEDAYLETLAETRKIHSLGDPCLVSLHGVEILMYHGRSLDDVISTVPGMSHSHPEKAMRLLLQARHLAPLYGGKTPLSPEKRDSLVVDRVPDIFHVGHVHAIEYATYRGVLNVNSGCWQERTGYMVRNGFTPTPAKVPVVNLQTLETTVVPFA
jgi:DNA polymerase II small subunit